MVEAWQLEPGGRVTETKHAVETQVEPQDCRDRATTLILEGRVERRASEVEPGHWRTEAKAEWSRSKVELEGRRSPQS